MKQLARMVTVLIGVMLFAASTAFAMKVDAETGKAYELLLTTFVAGNPVDASRVPQGATVLISSPDLVDGTYKGLKFVQQNNLINISVENEEANTASLNDVIVNTMVKIYGQYHHVEKSGVIVWGVEGDAQYPYYGNYDPSDGSVGMMCNAKQ
ncbi:MAG: hypothetical protein J6Z82_00725 [Schwartzia sp.]|nr:hypothetical protein [Schwartzia sp. (in: firmicutes)]